MKNSKTSKLAGWAGRVIKLSAQLALVFTAVTAFAPAQASAETRTLKLFYVHTGERAEITFKKNGRFLPDGLKKLNVFLRDWRHNEPTKMDPRLFDLVWQVYQTAGARDYITVVSAYRSPATNSMLRSRTRGVAKTSQHMLGKAMDFFVPGVPLKKLRDTAMRYQVGGVGYYPTSGSPFVHLDVGSVRHWPRMSRRELLAVFPNGNTIHVPTDGKPLPGYEQALAAYEARKTGSGSIMMASAKPKSKSLFGMLFGGGADEEEDTGESNGRAVAAARPSRAAPEPVAPVRAQPAPVVPTRAVPAQQEPEQAPQEALIAALPARNAPIPLNAPRPAAQIAAQEAPQAAEPVVMTPDAQAAMAFAVPVPVKRPQSATDAMLAMASPPPADTLEAQALAAANGAPSAPAEQVAALTSAETGAMLSGYVPVPVQRPQAAGQAINAVLASTAIPAPRPVHNQAQDVAQAAVVPSEAGQDAIADLLSNDPHTASIAAVSVPAKRPQVTQAAEQQVARAAEQQVARAAEQQVAMITPQEMGAVRNDVTVSDAAVRTTAKTGRSDRPVAKAASAVVQPADAATGVAISNEPVAKVVQVSNPVLRNEAMRKAPTVVYTAGFQKDLPANDANRFTGNAVTFMSIAKFSKTN